MLVFVFVRCLSDDIVLPLVLLDRYCDGVIRTSGATGFSLIPLIGSRITMFEFSTHDNKKSFENDFFFGGRYVELEWFGRES